MKRLHLHRNRSRLHPPFPSGCDRLPPGGDQRRGTVLIVVMGLLGLLMLLGFAFYTFSRQEESNAEYFAAAERVGAGGVATKTEFEWGLASIINGGPSDLPNSALWGGRHSLMANAFGRDVHPFSGRGLHVAVDQNGLQIIDQDFDTSTSESNAPFNFNDSPAAIAGPGNVADIFIQPTPGGPMSGEIELPDFQNDYVAPDAGYTYPDLNNIFLAYNGYGVDPNGTPIRTIIPSFDRPQYLREDDGSGNVLPIPNDERNKVSSTRRKVLRPHQEHMHIAPDGTVLGLRYLRTASGGVQPFALYDGSPPPTDLFDTQGQGAWEFTDATPAGTAPAYDYDADADGDGIDEAVYLDLDHPVLTLANGNDTRYVPLYAITIYDADGLLNLLAHGNVQGFPAAGVRTAGNRPFGDASTPVDGVSRFEMVHKSNLGATSFELNPQWGLTADLPSYDPMNPTPFTDEIQKLEQHAFYFERDFDESGSGITATQAEIANMEWFFSRVGRIEYGSRRSDVIDEFPGVYGEDQFLIATATGSGPYFANAFPKPGRTYGDDNGNEFFGEPVNSINQYNNFRQPLDVLGNGRSYDTTRGRKTLTATPSGFDGRFPGFVDYQTTRGVVGWRNYVGGNLMASVDVPIPYRLVDEAFEVNVDHPTQSPDDDILPISDMTYLQASDGDVDADNLTARAATLMSYNFAEHAEADEIRKRFTTLSWDTKNLGLSFPQETDTTFNSARSWEFSTVILPSPASPPADQYTGREFPPYYYIDTINQRFDPTTRGSYDPNNAGTQYPLQEPFRLATRLALRTVVDDRSRDPLPRQQRALALNGVTCTGIENNRRVAYTRQLTAHHPDPGVNAINMGVAIGQDPGQIPNNLATATVREAWARYDRQLLARDIYVMLYTLGGGDDAADFRRGPENTMAPGTYLGNQIQENPIGSGTRVQMGSTRQIDQNENGQPDDGEPKYRRYVYDDDKLHEMAQFAVNFVDSLDPDNVITKFEYDRDLSDGWNLDDDPYDAEDGSDEIAGGTTFSITQEDKGVVYGVERQELTLGEVLAFKTGQVTDSGAPKDLLPTEHNDDDDRFWTYVELHNAAPDTTTISGQWQIELEVGTTGARFKRRLTPYTSGSRDVPASGTWTVKSKGNPEQGVSTMSTETSNFRVDFGWDPASGMGMGTPDFSEAYDNVAPGPNPPLTYDILQTVGTWKLEEVDAAGTATSVNALIDNLPNSDPLINGAGAAQPVLRLKRRLHLGRNASGTLTPAQEQDNPWITVDESTLGEYRTLTFAQNDEAGWDIAHYLERGSQDGTGGNNKARSTERQDRLNRNGTGLHSDNVTLPAGVNPADPTTYAAFDDPAEAAQLRYHTLGQRNSNYVANLWQAHNDRFYHSVSELLTLPIYGPENVTDSIINSQSTGTGLASQEYFLRPRHPQFPNGPDGLPGGGDDLTAEANNRWYRLLEFLERPSPISREGEIRDPGLMNLNTIRYPASLAGLVDDPYAFDFTSYQDIKNNDLATQTSYMPDTYESGRDWWTQFLMSRDGGYNIIDTDSSGTVDASDSNPVRYDWTTGRILPGAPGAMPFRPLSFTTAEDFSLEHTALRHLPKAWDSDPNTAVNNAFPTRRLFELRTANETGSDIDAYGPYRLYSKILNNATLRSNVFFVFIKIDYFEVLEVQGGDPDPDNPSETVPAGYVLQKIGRQLHENDHGAATPKSKRGFFVIDRSKAFGQLTEENFDGDSSGNPTFAFWGDRNDTNPVPFDYKSLIVHQHVFKE